ncbi:MAG: protease modulator HflC [Spirochaetales bacterium]|nr:protease modulator HflC [Spirochaetales bacterium]
MKKLVIIAAVISAVILILGSAFFTVKADSYAIITEFGRVERVISEAGLNIKLPYPIQNIYRIDKKIRIFSPVALEVFIPDETNVLKNITIGYYIIWEISDPVKYFEILKTDSSAENRLSDNMRSYIYNIVGRYQLQAFLSTNSDEVQIDEISKKITEASIPDFARNYGISIISVDIKRVILPEQNKRKVFERMVAERERIAHRYRAEGEEQAKIIISETDSTKQIMLSQARLEAAVMIAEAEAEAAAIYSDAFKTNEKFYRFWNLLRAYEKIFEQNSTFILSTENKLLQLLEMDSDLLGLGE